MSSIAVKKILYNCSLNLHLVNENRRQLKQGSINKQALTGLEKNCQDIANRLKSVQQPIKSPALKEHYSLICNCLNEQQKKIQKLSKTLSPPSPKLEEDKSTEKKGSESTSFLRKALKAFESGNKKEGFIWIRKLQKNYPLVAKKLFNLAWGLEGASIVKKQPKLGHPRFGEVAFLGQENRSISSATRIKAIQRVLTPNSKTPSPKPKTPTSPTPSSSPKIPAIQPYYLADFGGNKKALLDKAWGDTLQILKHNGYTNLKGKFVPVDTSYSVQNTVCYKNAGPQLVRADGKKQVITIEASDCFIVAEAYALKFGSKTALLNMASESTPGGGVRPPSSTNAQEEQLFRISGAVDALSTPSLQGKQKENYYPLTKKAGSSSVGLYSPKVPIFRDGMKKGYAVKDKPFEVDLLSVAAIKNPPLSKKRLPKKEIEVTKEKIRTIFEMAYQKGVDTVILSAFGCGAYNNPPAHMAELFQEVLEKYYPSAFDRIVFAIIDDSASPKGDNFKPFAEHFIQRGAKIFDKDGVELSATDLEVAIEPAIPDFKDHKDEGSSTLHKKQIDILKNMAKSGCISFFDHEDPITGFLSTFSPCKVKQGKFTFDCGEAAYQAGRNPSRAKEFVKLSGPEAFKHRHKVPALTNWRQSSTAHMEKVLTAKFSQNTKLQKLLLATGKAHLLMHTDKDNFWGDGGKPESGNQLGKLLMKIRGQLGGTGLVSLPPSAPQE